MPRGTMNTVTELTLEIAAILRAHIARERLNQGAIAKAAGVSPAVLSGIVNGIKRIDIEQLDRITQAVGLPLLDVVKRADQATGHRRIDSGIKPVG